MQQSQPWKIEMLNTGARLHLYLQPTKSNSINVLVGLLPQSDQTNGKLIVHRVRRLSACAILLAAVKPLD